jgi:magnesium chelatase family protein
LLDRIDLHVDVPAIAAADLMLPPPAEGSREVAERVAAARDIQIARYYAGLGLPGIVSNAAAPANVIEAIAQPHARGLALIKEASERLHLSARG